MRVDRAHELHIRPRRKARAVRLDRCAGCLPIRVQLVDKNHEVRMTSRDLTSFAAGDFEFFSDLRSAHTDLKFVFDPAVLDQKTLLWASASMHNHAITAV